MKRHLCIGLWFVCSLIACGGDEDQSRATGGDSTRPTAGAMTPDERDAGVDQTDAVDGGPSPRDSSDTNPRPDDVTELNACECPTASAAFLDAHGSACVLKYFRDRVWPVIETNCASCHAEGQIGQSLGARWALDMTNPNSNAGLEKNFNEVFKMASTTGRDMDGNVNSLLVLKPTGLFKPPEGQIAHTGGTPIPPDSSERVPLDTLSLWALRAGGDFVLCDDSACEESDIEGVCQGDLNEDDALAHQDASRDERSVRRLSDYEYNRVLSDIIHPSGRPSCATDEECLTKPNERCVLGKCVVSVTGSFPQDPDLRGFRNDAKQITMTADRAFAYLDASETVAQYIVQNLVGAYGGPACGDADSLDTPECAQSFIRGLGQKIYRRKLKESGDRNEVEMYYEKYRNDANLSENGLTFQARMQGVVQIMLNSPQFLFRTEVGVKDESRSDEASGVEAYTLTEEEIATAIAFLVTGHGPDDALIEAIETEDLTNADVIRTHVNRLSRTQSVPLRGFAEGFFHAWLGLNRIYLAHPKADESLDTTSLSRAANALFAQGQVGTSTREAVVQDALGFAVHQFASGSLRDLMTSRAVGLGGGADGLSNTMATLYDVSAGSNELNDKRKGLLTRAALAIGYALHDGPSPIFRGKFLRQRFFCFEPAPPPPGVLIEELQALDGDSVTTTRERFRLHRESGSSCYGCHRYMDPLGNTMGQFDQFGTFRSNEAISGEVIDTTGSVEVTCSGESDPTGRNCQLSGIDELSDYLINEPSVRHCLAEQLAGYAFGEYETASIRDVATELQSTLVPDGQLSDFIIAIAGSQRFSTRFKYTVVKTDAILDPCEGQCNAETQDCDDASGVCILKPQCELDTDCETDAPKCVGGQCTAANACNGPDDCALREICQNGSCTADPNVRRGSELDMDCARCVGKVIGEQPLQSDAWCLIACKQQGGCDNVPVCEGAADGRPSPAATCFACLSKRPSLISDEWCFNQCAYGDGASCADANCSNEYPNAAARDEAVAAQNAQADMRRTEQLEACSRCRSNGEMGSESTENCQFGCRSNINAGIQEMAQPSCGAVDPTWGCVWVED
ncbi:MAG: DUF1588 domain-containing protein [Myxococcota bacterium]|nr:DUF1588 domain-containing protein [Myxococcota bacterium]